MQDLAGMRIVSDCNRHQQDRIAGKLMQLFAEFGPPSPKLVDRRTNPSHGYRAIHVIVTVDGAPVEIQVRTKLQHEWADLFEKLADRVATPDDLADLTAGIAEDFASIRSRIGMFEQHVPPENP